MRSYSFVHSVLVISVFLEMTSFGNGVRFLLERHIYGFGYMTSRLSFLRESWQLLDVHIYNIHIFLRLSFADHIL